MILASLDWVVLAPYFVAIIGVGVWFGRGERSTDDYFLGGRRQPWVIVGLSILATELSALTFVSVPGRAYQTDCDYLQLYVGAFLGRMVIVWLLLPAFYRGNVTTVYEYLGQRFGPWTRSTASLLFFASRIIGSGLRLLVASMAISMVFHWPLYWVIFGAAAVAIAYTAFGGIKAIIWTDALQALVFVGAAGAVLVFLAVATPGTLAANLNTAADAGKFHVFHWDLNPNNDKAFWVLVIHTLLLNAAVFGTDQDLTQRMLTCSSLKNGQRSLVFNALMGFPVVVLFLLVGVGMFVYYRAFPDGTPPAELSRDRVFPFFIAHSLPSGWGLKGLLVAGVFAAAMSSLDSALGALSSSAVTDFYRPYIAPGRSGAHYVRIGRMCVILFGILLAFIAVAFAGQRDLLQQAFDWASLIFGSMLGVFLLAVLTKSRGRDRVNPILMLTGVAALAALKWRQDWTGEVIIAWPWWIVLGTFWTFGVGALFRSPTEPGGRETGISAPDQHRRDAATM